MKLLFSVLLAIAMCSLAVLADLAKVTHKEPRLHHRRLFPQSQSQGTSVEDEEHAVARKPGPLPNSHGQTFSGSNVKPKTPLASSSSDSDVGDLGHGGSVTGSESSGQFVGYLVTHFVSEKGDVYQSLSNGNDPYSFTPLNGGKPILTATAPHSTGGVRDPYLIARSDRGMFYIVGTDLAIEKTNWAASTRTGSLGMHVWSSKDLVNWSSDSLVLLEESGAGMLWAPTVVEVDGTFHVFWFTNMYHANDNGHKADPSQWGVTHYSTTKDFKTFSPPKQYDVKGMDLEFQKLGGNSFARFAKNADKVFEEVSHDGLFGKWTRVGGQNSFVTNKMAEGPASFRDNKQPNLFHLWLDDFSKSGTYLPYETNDILSGHYTPSPAPHFPRNLRHGSVLPVTQKEYE